MAGSEKLRIDKYLWAVRLFKTRSLASEACRKGRVIINNVQVKPSHTVCTGEIIVIKKPPVLFTYKVIDLAGNRLPAKLVNGYVSDLTSGEEKAKILLSKTAGQGIRLKGFGRPTKKERRTIDRYKDDMTDY